MGLVISAGSRNCWGQSRAGPADYPWPAVPAYRTGDGRDYSSGYYRVDDGYPITCGISYVFYMGGAGASCWEEKVMPLLAAESVTKEFLSDQKYVVVFRDF